MAELRAAEAQEAEKKRRLDEMGSGDDSGTEAETVIETGDAKSGSKEVEPVEKRGELIDRAGAGGSKSEHSTEDEWERVSENEKDK